MKHCQWCDNNFVPKVSYQIYCGPECREHATKEKIAERYAITRRQKRKNKKRICKQCGARLSAYNDDPLCSSCLINPTEVSRALRELRGLSNES